MLDALLDTYGRYDLFEQAVRAATDRAGVLRAQHEQELAVTEAEIAKAEAAIDRYLLAFESGTLPESQCGERVRSLVTKLDDLRRQREDSTEALEAASTSPPTVEQVTDVRAEIQAAIESGTTPTKKALLQALVQEITVEGRHAIQPVFRVPSPTNQTMGKERFASCRDRRPR